MYLEKIIIYHDKFVNNKMYWKQNADLQRRIIVGTSEILKPYRIAMNISYV